MKIKLRLMLLGCSVMLLGGCQLGYLEPTPTPLPGWRSSVSELLVDDAVFPRNWHVLFPEDTSTDPTTNHVGRAWGHASGSGVQQGIWRSYTVADAQEWYIELRQSQFYPSRSPSPDTIFVEFEPPPEIAFKSQRADDFYLACGWWGVAYCEVVARYRNYVTDIRMDHEANYNGHHTDGLTYEQIEAIVKNMDAKFVEALDTLPTPPPE